jgi:predicted lipoprotein with Yx(FWY)xxD motif
MGLSHQSSVRRTAPRTRSALIATGIAVVAMAGAAVAADPTVMKGSARISGQTKSVVVNSAGQTLYTLSGEQVGRHSTLKCINQTCFGTWLPYKVTANQSLSKGAGVRGTLSKLQRVRARFYQVTLNGRPLYRYAGDNNTKGSARGQGIRSFGGTWQVVTP